MPETMMRMLEKIPRLAGWACCIAGLAVVAAGPAKADDFAEGHVLVKIQPGVQIQAVANSYASTVKDQVPGSALYSLSTPVNSDEDTFVQKLSLDSRVVFAETDEILDSPEFHGKQIHFAFDKGPNAGGYVNQTAYQQVDTGRTPAGATGAGIVVAVLDTGATFNHPALAGHFLPGCNMLQPGRAPLDVADGTTNLAVGHGTMIAGIILRIAPNARILPVRVVNADGIGTMLDVAKGIHFAVTQGARVINMSFGAPKLTETMREALDEAKNAGVVLVAAAGNDGLNQVQYPAAGGNVLAVASVESNDAKSSYSNYGSFIQVVAPGTGIRSTYSTGGYATWSGTSFAVPFVSAEAALILSVKPSLSGGNCVSQIDGTARSVDAYNPNYTGLLGKGIIDIGQAVLNNIGGGGGHQATVSRRYEGLEWWPPAAAGRVLLWSGASEEERGNVMRSAPSIHGQG